MYMGEVWTRGIKPTSGQLLIATKDPVSQESRLKMGNLAISTSDFWPQIIVRDKGLVTMLIGPVSLHGLDLVSSQLSFPMKDPWPQGRRTKDLGSQESRLKMGFSAISTSDLC